MSLNQTAVLETQVVKRKSTKSIVTGVLLIATGVALWWFSSTIADKSSSLYMFCAVASGAGLLVGLLKLLFGGKELIYQPTGSRITGYSIYFESLQSDALSDLLMQGRFDTVRSARRKENGPVKMDVQRSADGQFVSLQVWQFVPYNYEQVGTPICFCGDEAARVIEAVGK